MADRRADGSSCEDYEEMVAEGHLISDGRDARCVLEIIMWMNRHILMKVPVGHEEEPELTTNDFLHGVR